MVRTGNSGIAHTYSMIDKVIKEINSAIRNCEWSITHDDVEGAKDAISDLDHLEGIMEDIRTANLGLREYGDEQYSKVEELEKEVFDLNRKIEDLDDEKTHLESKIEDLEFEIEELNTELEELKRQDD